MPPPRPLTHQLQLLLLPILQPGQVLGQVGAGELVPQAPGNAQHLAGDAAEGHRDLVHQLPVTREVIVRGAAQVCAVAPVHAEEPPSPHRNRMATPHGPHPGAELPLPQAAPGGFSCHRITEWFGVKGA